MANKKYERLTKEIIDFVGGKGNISYLAHCVTRLRFTVKDKSRVKCEEIEKLPAVIGINWAGDQLQVIVGQGVADVYKEICQIHEFEMKDQINENEDHKKFSVATIFDYISGCVAPCVPVLIGGGMIKVVLLILLQIKLLTATSDTYVTLNFVGDAPFYFLPVLVGANAAKKFGANMGIGLVLGAILLHPTFVELVAKGSGGSVFGVPIAPLNYGSNVFAMIITMFVCAKVEKLVVKYSPSLIRSVTEPLLTFIIMAPLMLCVFAPLGAGIGSYLTIGFEFLYNTFGFLGLAILTSVIPLLVLTGMHMSFPALAMQNFATFGYDPLLCVASIIPNFNQGAACLAVAFKTKQKDLRSEAASAAATAIVAGVSEPALFGVTLRLKTPLYAVMIGSFAGAAIAGIFQCVCYAFPGSFALFSLITFIGDKGISNLIFMIVAIIVGMVTTFILTMILYKPEQTIEKR